jgi:hypothetical protein
LAVAAVLPRRGSPNDISGLAPTDCINKSLQLKVVQAGLNNTVWVACGPIKAGGFDEKISLG